MEAALNGSNAEKGVEIEQVLVEDNSPYPEVSSSRFLSPLCADSWTTSHTLRF